MKISKKFNLPKYEDSTQQQIRSFWESRKIKFDNISENYYEGNRGNTWGNLTSFDMSNLITKLHITRDESNEISCEFDIKTFGQQITEWNKVFWQLELDTFESVLLKGDYQETEWSEYNISSSKKDSLWMVKYIVTTIVVASIFSFVFYFLR